MNTFQLKKAISDSDVQMLADMADKIWHECFPGIISEQQIEYMIEKFQSYRAMQAQIAEQAYSYYFIEADGIDIGYTAVKPEQTKMFLSKLYLFSDYRGKGYARKAVEELKKISAEHGKSAIHLTVNRNNNRAIEAYKKLGFVVTGTQVADIGDGYVMDDFLMELKI